MGYSITAIKGIGWLGNLQILVRVLTVIKLVVIAHFLNPFEYGVFAIILICISLFETIFEIGIPTYLIQLKEEIKPYISTAWVLGIIKGIIITVCILIFSYPFSSFFQMNSYFSLFLLAGFGPLIKGFSNPAIAQLQKDLRFKAEFSYRFCVFFLDFIFSLGLIIWLRSPLALVLALLLTATSEFILSWIFVSLRPTFTYEKEKARKIVSFGKWIALASSTTYLMNQLDNAVVGKILGTATLGVYQISQRFSVNPISEGTDLISKVTFPIYSRIHDDKKRMQRMFWRIFSAVFSGGVIIAFILFFFAGDIIYILAGKEWMGAVLPLRIFAILGILSGLVSTMTTIFLATKNQHIIAKLTTIRLITLAVLVIPLTLWFGVVGAAFSSLISFTVIVPIAALRLRKIFNTP